MMDQGLGANSARKLKARACAAIDARAADLVSVSLDLHRNPEIAFQEVRSSRLLADRIAAAGLPVTHPAFDLPTAFMSEFGRAGAPVIGIIAEYDALPGLGHACGHNVIGTSALGAALALADLGEDLPGRVRLLGTPAEEGGGGKVLMAARGAFAGLDGAMMVHPADCNLPSFPLIANARLRAVFTGRPAHASAMPEAGVNALDALVTAYVAIAALRQQMPGTHRIHAIICEGGEATNIIPARAVGEFGIRAPRLAELEALRLRIEACLRAGAIAAGAEVEIERDPVEYHDLIANAPLARTFRANAEALGRRFAEVEALPPGQAASTDFGNVSQMVPAIHPMIATVPPGTAFHTPDFALHSGSPEGMKAMLDAAKAMAMTALDFFCDSALRSAVAQDFARATAPE